MPPRKSKSKQATSTTDSTRASKAQLSKQEETTDGRAKKGPNIETAKKETVADGSSSTLPSKRKATPASSSAPNKAPRRSGRGASKVTVIDQTKMLQFLISPAATDLCHPKDEIGDLAKHGSNLKTYFNLDLSPFEELVCAVVLSRPISHRLGVRTIRTIFNEPYNFNTPKAIHDAGEEKRHQALWDARTQHKDKTARELGGLADVVLERFAEGEDDVSLEKVRTEAEHDVYKVQ